MSGQLHTSAALLLRWNPGAHSIGGLVGSRAKEKNLLPMSLFRTPHRPACSLVTLLTELSWLPFFLLRRTFEYYDWCTLLPFRTFEGKKIHHFFRDLNSSLQFVLSDSPSWSVTSPAFQVMVSKCMAHASEPLISWQWINKMTALLQHYKVYCFIY
jgi:hypothetical protein